MTVLKVKDVENQLREKHGNMAAVARAFGVTRQAVFNCVQKHQRLQDVIHDARESMKDNAESSLHKAMLSGEAWAVCFYLKTQAKDRGYIEKTQQEHTGKDDSPLKVEFLIPTNGRNPAHDSVGGAQEGA